jgi:hypothetical protein
MMSTVLLFGFSTPAGASFASRLSDFSLLIAGRNSYCLPPRSAYVRCDLTAPVDMVAPELARPMTIVSFAPIWHFSDFLSRLNSYDSTCMARWNGVIACSSSSVLTKRFAFNRFDQALVKRLRRSEELLSTLCHQHSLPCKVLAPTLIYGNYGGYVDRNLSRLSRLLRILPFLLLPSHTGERQPIHCQQLAAVAWKFVESIRMNPSRIPLQQHIFLGGDETVTYREMLRRLRDAHQPCGSMSSFLPAYRCLFLILPDRLFYFLTSPALFFSPKLYEALLRIGADLSGFQKAHELTATQPSSFPLGRLDL